VKVFKGKESIDVFFDLHGNCGTSESTIKLAVGAEVATVPE